MHFLQRSLALLLLLSASVASAQNYQFDGKISEEVLRNYLSRAITQMYLLIGQGDFEDNARMLKECGVKFTGRAMHQWGRENGGESHLPDKLAMVKTNAARLHALDPEMILQACIFEIVSADVDNLAVPPWAFAAMGLPAETRNFRYDAMLYPSGLFRDHWGKGSSVPDVSQPETKLFFMYLAAAYIDAGCEAIHFGQVELMNRNDPKLEHWTQVFTLAREYAAKKARRHFLILDAHVPGGGFVKDGKLLLDFHSFPLRVEEQPQAPREGKLRVGFIDSLYGRSKGGVTPSGWRTDHLPYLVELDNFGRSQKPGEAGQGGCWVWGWDEITWFSQLSEGARNQWLRYAWAWVRERDAAGYLQMPGSRCLAGSPDRKRWYYANRQSPAVPEGFNQEATIKAIWTEDNARKNSAKN